MKEELTAMNHPHVGEQGKESLYHLFIVRILIPAFLWVGVLLIAISVGLRIYVGPSEEAGGLWWVGWLCVMAWAVFTVLKHGGVEKTM
ncbi:MAG: hypothetical protein G01um101429_1127 [Parcubacteria group bacterium Gr01-1014_29]|nr:MAG: hypothetical protein G01um101429_1127 [Parcubacteria group bacterium Gr01-1014_29]